MKTALITGFTGQDGTFLAKHLLEEGWKVIGLVRRISTEPPRRVRGKFDFSDYISSNDLELVEGDLLSISSLINIIRKYTPDHIYNLAAQSHVGVSFGQPEFTIESNFMGVVNLITALETVEDDIREHGVSEYAWRLYQASTSEMFGDKRMGTTLDEISRIEPRSPYAIAKAAAHFYCRMKREQGKFISNGILFNHESEIRGGDFVTQKIARGAVRTLYDREFVLELGNLDSGRDWGYAADYVKAMHRMLEVDKPGEYVVATSETHTVRDFVDAAYATLEQKIVWMGEGEDEIGQIDGRTVVRINPKFYRPNDVTYLHGDATEAREKLGWEPETKFVDLVKIMVEAAEEEY